MFQFLGILILLVGVAIYIIKFFTVMEDEFEEGQDHRGEAIRQKVTSKSPDWMINLNRRLSTFFIVFGLLIFMIPYLIFFADRGYNYLLVHPGGKLDAVMVQGIKWRGFAKIDPWQKFIDVKVVAEGVEYDAKELEGIMNPIPLRFIDQVTAHGLVSTRFQLPSDKKAFIKLAIEFRSMSNLVNNTIIPTISEQLVQTAYMFAAQDYISGEAQSFRQTFEEQLKDGTYAVEKIEHSDTIWGDIEVKGEQRRIREIRTRYEVIKIMKNGVPLRIPHELSENNIRVSQVIVNQLILDPTFKKRLEKQRDESALRQLEQQKIETAKATQQRIIAEGERDKSAERVTQEKLQVSKLIAIETKLKEEKTNMELAGIALLTARLTAQKIKVIADADAYEIRQKVKAGITPEKELQMRLDANVSGMSELAKTKWPEFYFNSPGSKGSGGPLESIIMSAMSKQLTSTIVKK